MVSVSGSVIVVRCITDIEVDASEISNVSGSEIVFD